MTDFTLEDLEDILRHVEEHNADGPVMLTPEYARWLLGKARTPERIDISVLPRTGEVLAHWHADVHGESLPEGIDVARSRVTIGAANPATLRALVRYVEGELENIEAGTPGVAGNIPIVARTVVYALVDQLDEVQDV